MAHDEPAQLFGPKNGDYNIASVKKIGEDFSHRVYFYTSAGSGLPDWDQVKKDLYDVYQGRTGRFTPVDARLYTGQQLIAYYDDSGFHKN